MKKFPQPKEIYRCDGCGKQTPNQDICCEGWKVVAYIRADKYDKLREALESIRKTAGETAFTIGGVDLGSRTLKARFLDIMEQAQVALKGNE